MRQEITCPNCGFKHNVNVGEIVHAERSKDAKKTAGVPRPLGRGHHRRAALYTANGITKRLDEWAAEIGTTKRALYDRVRKAGNLQAVIDAQVTEGSQNPSATA